MESSGAEVEVIFANHPEAILKYADKILNCDIHTRARTKRILKKAGAKVVCGLDDIMTASINGSGYNEKYGLLGSNKSTEDKVKLFPHQCQSLVEEIQVADPVVSPAFTSGLVGTPNELKLKYLADNDFANLSGEELKKAITDSIVKKSGSLVGNMASEGTTPRQLTDLIGSLCDLTSGSGDKGTPVVLVQGYFDNYSN